MQEAERQERIGETVMAATKKKAAKKAAKKTKKKAAKKKPSKKKTTKKAKKLSPAAKKKAGARNFGKRRNSGIYDEVALKLESCSGPKEMLSYAKACGSDKVETFRERLAKGQHLGVWRMHLGNHLRALVRKAELEKRMAKLKKPKTKKPTKKKATKRKR